MQPCKLASGLHERVSPAVMRMRWVGTKAQLDVIGGELLAFDEFGFEAVGSRHDQSCQMSGLRQSTG